MVTHYCDADLDTVWEMWTQPELLELWWAPKPWKAETINMDFREGGQWLYAMIGPNDEKAYSVVRYTRIARKTSLYIIHARSNAEGVLSTTTPQKELRIGFAESADGVEVTVSTGSVPHIQKQLENLDEELSRRMAF